VPVVLWGPGKQSVAVRSKVCTALALASWRCSTGSHGEEPTNQEEMKAENSQELEAEEQ
jgi:hypothetical protein